MTKELEAELIASVLAGDADSFEPLVKEHEKKIYNLALRMTGDPDDAYDCAQDAFVKAYTSLKDFRGESAFDTATLSGHSNHELKKLADIIRALISDQD